MSSGIAASHPHFDHSTRAADPSSGHSFKRETAAIGGVRPSCFRALRRRELWIGAEAGPHDIQAKHLQLLWNLKLFGVLIGADRNPKKWLS